MKELVRGQEPSFLVAHGRRWAEAFVEARSKNPSARFRWASHQGRPVNQHLIEPLRAMTQGHCAYCDGSPVAALSAETIDHFRPKSAFPEASYTWDNLFYACDRCQGAKLERFDALLLKPDDAGYSFDRYFQVNHRTGDLEPSATASVEDQARARITIKMFALNHPERSQQRRRTARDFAFLSEDERAAALDDYPYRFMLRDAL